MYVPEKEPARAMTVWLRLLTTHYFTSLGAGTAPRPILVVVNMSDLEVAFYCCGAILWGLSGEGGPGVQAITIIGLFIFFWMVVFGDNSPSGSGSTNAMNAKKAKHFGISSSRIRGYDVLIDYIQFHSSGDESPIMSIEEGISRFEKIKENEPLLSSDAKNFFSSPYVIATIGIGGDTVESVGGGNDSDVTVGGICTIAGCPKSVMFNNNVCYKHRDLPDHSKKIGDDWWEKGYETEEAKPSQKNDPDGESCGNPWCSNSVSAFDFRCFTCRRRFCSEHAGAKIECNECSQ